MNCYKKEIYMKGIAFMCNLLRSTYLTYFLLCHISSTYSLRLEVGRQSQDYKGSLCHLKQFMHMYHFYSANNIPIIFGDAPEFKGPNLWMNINAMYLNCTGLLSFEINTRLCISYRWLFYCFCSFIIQIYSGCT